MRAFDVGTDDRNVVHPLLQRHVVSDGGHRVGPCHFGDGLLIAIADNHRGGRFAIVAAQFVWLFINAPARPSSSDFENDAVRVAEVNRHKVVAVERAFYIQSEVGQSPLPFQQAIIICNLKRKVVCTANAGVPLLGARPFKESNSRAGAAQFVAKI